MKYGRFVLPLLLLIAGAAVLADAVNAAYRLQAQDRITVTVLRHPELSQTYSVPPDGQLDFPRIGQVNVLGKTTAELSAALTTQLASVLRDPEVTVTLVDMRPQYVYVLGSVTRPGPYPLQQGMRLTELLAAAGDLSGDREQMTASLIRANVSTPVDLRQAIEGKNPADNPVLHEGDTLWVQPPTRITVVVSGQVKTPGAVKLPPHSKLIDALAQAGDLVDRPDRVTITLQRGTLTQPLPWGDTTTSLQDGDVILVEQEQLSRIYINGQVRNPGAYELPPGCGVLEALALAGGQQENAALGQVTIVHSGGKTEQLNLAPALNQGKVEQNPLLAPGDQVIVPESTTHISVMGMVNKPGQIAFNDSKVLTVVDAISIAGGEQKRAKLSHVVVIRVQAGKAQRITVDVNAILKKGRQDLNIPLMADDVVYVPESNSLVLPDLLSILSQAGVLAVSAASVL